MSLFPIDYYCTKYCRLVNSDWHKTTWKVDQSTKPGSALLCIILYVMLYVIVQNSFWKGTSEVMSVRYWQVCSLQCQVASCPKKLRTKWCPNQRWAIPTAELRVMPGVNSVFLAIWSRSRNRSQLESRCWFGVGVGAGTDRRRPFWVQIGTSRLSYTKANKLHYFWINVIYVKHKIPH